MCRHRIIKIPCVSAPLRQSHHKDAEAQRVNQEKANLILIRALFLQLLAILPRLPGVLYTPALSTVTLLCPGKGAAEDWQTQPVSQRHQMLLRAYQKYQR